MTDLEPIWIRTRPDILIVSDVLSLSHYKVIENLMKLQSAIFEAIWSLKLHLEDERITGDKTEIKEAIEKLEDLREMI